MNNIEMKQEFAKRYIYLYKNSEFILAPYMNEKTMTLSKIDTIMLYRLEEILLGDKPLEQTMLYNYIENKKQDKDYLEMVKSGIQILQRKNENYNNYHEIFKYNLDSMKILIILRRHIEDQSKDLENKKRKLQVLDEYLKIEQYKNIDPEILYKQKLIPELNLHKNSLNNNPSRNKHDIGITSNKFIHTFSGINAIHLTENEIQSIYLTVHDELPWNQEITCINDEFDNIKKPKITIPCHQTFNIQEEEIFIYEKNYYQLCPHCGYIVNIPNRLLSEGIKERIKNHCLEDPYLSRKMILYSELKRLEKISSNNKHKKLIRTK